MGCNVRQELEVDAEDATELRLWLSNRHERRGRSGDCAREKKICDFDVRERVTAGIERCEMDKVDVW